MRSGWQRLGYWARGVVADRALKAIEAETERVDNLTKAAFPRSNSNCRKLPGWQRFEDADRASLNPFAVDSRLLSRTYSRWVDTVIGAL